jgi:hypothetical protein
MPAACVFKGGVPRSGGATDLERLGVLGATLSRSGPHHISVTVRCSLLNRTDGLHLPLQVPTPQARPQRELGRLCMEQECAQASS